MTKTNAQFTEQDHQQITQSVVAAEAKTSAEIMPVVAKSSGRYDRPEDIVGLWCGVLAFIAAWWIMPSPSTDANSWGGPSAAFQLFVYIASLVAGFFVGVVLAMRVNWLRALFTPKAQMAEDVLQRARSVFYDRRVHHTAGGTGVLIYVSLFEHRAAIIADESVLNKLGLSALDEICHQLTTDLSTGTIPNALCNAIATTGEKLSGVLPRDDNDVNELSDALVVLD
jgi:putative membrane protein